MANTIIASKCPVCNNHLSLKRGQDPRQHERFDPEEDMESLVFIILKHSEGRKGGIITDSGLTLEEAAKDPVYRPLVDRLHARVARLNAYLNEINQ